MPDETPQFRVSNEGEPIPPVDPEDLKRRWNTWKQHLTGEAARAAQSQEADRVAVTHRFRMVSSLEGFNNGQLLAPWKHGEDLDDAVFRVAATFPIRPLRQEVYTVPGDSMWGFDPNAFVDKLIEETGISHTWEPVPARIPEGSGGTYMKVRTSFGPEAAKKFSAARGSEQEAKQDARELLWAVWRKCQPNLSRASGNHELHVTSVAWHFADFAVENIHLAREFVSRMNGIRGGEAGEGRQPLTILLELERRATWFFDLECSVCSRLMREHSDEERAHCNQALPPGGTPYRWRTHAIEFSDQSAMQGDIAVALLSEDGEQLSALQSCLEATRVGREVFRHVGFPTGPTDSILHQLQESRAQVVVVGVSPRDVQRSVRVIELLRATNTRPLAIFASYPGNAGSTDPVAIMRAGSIAYFSSSTGSDAFLRALTHIMQGARWKGRDGQIEGLEIT